MDGQPVISVRGEASLEVEPETAFPGHGRRLSQEAA